MHSGLASVTQDHTFKFYPCYIMHQYFVHFYGSVVCHFMYASRFFFYLPMGRYWVLSCLGLVGYKSIGVQRVEHS